ncbi:MAG: alpha/beta hydrolase-fold protein [Planctomycetaceae bacterium]
MSLRTFIPFLLAAVLFPAAIHAADENPDRVVHPDVPTGRTVSGTFSESEIFPGTSRDWSVYIPAQYSADKPASLMVFMDGGGYSRANGAFRVPTVFDNLIHRGAMPVTIAVFVNPGTIPPTADGAAGRSNRSFEYDSLGDRYVRFLLEEFLPVALKDLNVSAEPQDRALCGISSGAICAFNAAWERPDQFGKVLSHIGSYTNIRGGWALPGLVRLTQDQPRALRVYLQEGRDDLDNLHGNWPLGNQDLAAALQFAGYTYRFVMTEGGHSGRWGGEELPAALEWLWSENPESTVIPSTESKPQWQPHPDAIAKDDVPRGRVLEMEPWQSQIFAGTSRKWSVYVPAQYKADTPAALMIFQDGERMRNTKGRWRIPTVFDNLIAAGQMPPTIAVFLDPGHHIDRPRQKNRSSNRSFEYDSLGDRYYRFLTEEIIPQIRSEYSISDDPEMWAIGGSSSGAICAFTVAWEHPERFRRVYSNVGSFTNLRGGNVYPSLVRKTEPKPIRVYMADTSGDIDNPFGSWPLSNQLMASALKYMGYDLRFDWAEGYAHNADFGSSRFPDAMKWLWREEQHAPVFDTSGDLGGDMTLLNLLVPGQGWELVAEDLGFADALCADADGNLYFCDMRAPAIVRINTADGSQTIIAEQSVSGLEFGPNGLLYACQGSQQRVISLHPETGDLQVVAEGVRPNDLAVTSSGFLFFTQTPTSQVMRVNLQTGELSVAHTGITRPNGIALSPDGGTLAVSDYGGESTWTFRVNADGTLDAAMPTMPMRLPIDPDGEFAMRQAPPYRAASRGDGMAVDALGRYYVTSDAGVQIFDPTGRPCGVLPKVDVDQPLTTCMLAGADGNSLYIAHGKKIYRRTLTVRKHVERNR